jgi:site-specific DNA-methyltransferase (cytosine-N4-specific)
LKCQIKTYIQPFERHLALEELKALAKGRPLAVGGRAATASAFRIESGAKAAQLREHLAYWQTVGADDAHTSQLLAEATFNVARNGVALNDLPELVPLIIKDKLPNKRCLRYATHGLHEYRGKFFPQLVRALMNMASVPPNGIVIDPMCGSGTTLVEAALSGRTAYGLDMNPLSAFVADVKCRALHLNPKELIREFEALVTAVGEPAKRSYFQTLSHEDQGYLQKWFSKAVLAELDQIKFAVDAISEPTVHDFFRLCLSNILRAVSWQKDDDLRVRKEVIAVAKGEVTARFSEEARRSTKMLVAYLSQAGRKKIGKHTVYEADARTAKVTLRALTGKVDAIITSPPYATALPYLDTDRLSLIYLKLLPRGEHRSRDVMMIGNREISGRIKEAYWATYERDRKLLPSQTRSLIERIDRLNKSANVGFRRRNLSALLSKYFFDMRSVLIEQRGLLKSRGTLFMVVGNNRTTAGGKEIEIQTTEHLARIAASVGFRVAGKLPMEMLRSRDIFRKNAMPSEEILTLQKA